MKTIVKRDGRVVPFNKERIYNAVCLAMKAIGEVDPAIALSVADIVSDFDEDSTTVEEIQDRVENTLMDLGHHDIAREYIIYRNQRSKVRENNSKIVRTVFTKIKADAVENSNANVDERAFDGRKKEASDAVQKITALDLNMPADIAEAHTNGYIYQHDLSDYNVGDHNCLFLDVQHVFKDGFTTRNGAVRGPGSLMTACQLFAVACQCQSQVQFGGVGSAHIDFDLAPYVKKSFVKKFKAGLKYLNNGNDECRLPDDLICIDNETIKELYPEAYTYAMDMLEEEGTQAAQSLYHNLNTLESRAGGQVPFTSINLGRDTSTEGRLVTRWMMEASLDGIGKFHTTSIFPISIFSYKQGVNANPGDPNYDLKRLALKSLSKRIYPNWVNGDWSQAHEDANDPDTFMATMGCVDGQELITYRYYNAIYTESFRCLWDRVSAHTAPKCQRENDTANLYIDAESLEIYDCVEDKFVTVKRVIRNTSTGNWMDVTAGPRILRCTDDHPFHTVNRGRIHAKDLTTDDTIIINRSQFSKDIISVDPYRAWYFGRKLSVPSNIMTWSSISRLAFLLGMIHTCGDMSLTDHDGIICWFEPTIKEAALQQMAIVQSLGMPASVYVDNTSSECPENEWYRVKFTPSSEMMKFKLHMDQNIDDEFVFCNKSTTSVNENINISKIEKLPADYSAYSYDVETESDHFEVSGIYSHNCRTMMGYDRHGLGYSRVGRGNNVPITMILPKIALECGIALGTRTEPDLELFNKKFEDLLKLTEKALLDRYNIMKSQSPKSAPFMYRNGTIKFGQKCTETVEESLKHNSLAFGFIGVAETCQALFGKNHASGDEKVYNFALNMVKRIYDFAKECSEKHDLNFVCYATPAEGLCRTALVKLRDEFGVIPNITDREYITNSFHVPVWEEVSIYDKLRLEAPFTKYATGGTITYVELDSSFMQNLDAVEAIIDYAFKELDIPYLAFNFPIDTCMDCGYSSEFNDCCPQCGSKNIEQLRRVTGYLTTDYSHFNAGKIAEVKDRVKHSKFTDFTKPIK